MKEKYPSSIEKKEKPPFLFHASINKEIDVFKPSNKKIRDKNEGPVVFAAKDKAYASMFLVRTDDTWTFKGNLNGQYTIIISDKERFQNIDQGGAIYKIPSESFSYDPDKGMRDKEWTSKTEVKPIDKYIYNSALEAMMENGVQIYFVNKEVFNQIVNTKGEDRKTILNKLKPFDKNIDLI